MFISFLRLGCAVLTPPATVATLGRPELRASMRTAIVGICLALLAFPAVAKQESLWIEKVAVLAVGQGICGVPMNNDAMQISIGSAMIELAISKDAVIARGRKRAHYIVADLQKQKTQGTFCPAFNYYLEHGYPR
ncbi:hypothetical protein HJC03_23510 [Rhizobium sp. NLR4b]|uniref:hypothetical protein n=1 Tax=Rhizobium sp. NLR4b TaxID=2731118 RepID=UPI001C83F653|nr:hypothetical protein [Rhizobium sp. NLR4b]MBX5253340.1 hypothetical protein [Rhizobium sp. NLR4b]